MNRNSAEGLSGRLGAFLASPWALVVAVILAFLLNSGALPLTDVDEGAFSEATREMLERGNLVSPTLNGAPRHDKPILIYWAQAASVSLFGVSELAFRLPSLIAAVLWLLAIVRFCRRHGDGQTAQTAGLVMALSVMVGVIAKAAIADALLNLLLSAALLGLYDYFQAVRSGRARTADALWIHGLLGLAFLTKGPVAILLPGVIGTLFFVAHGQWRPWFGLVFRPLGLALFLAIVLPWHIMVYLDQGFAFLVGFYLHHNLDRYTSTFEGHGGSIWYYVPVLALVLMPFTGWLLASLKPLWRTVRPGSGEAGAPLERFLLIWFVVVFILFSSSRTQLPHYLLYGCTPLFILLARYRAQAEMRLLAWLPAVLMALLLLALPELLTAALARTPRPHESLLISGLLDGLAGTRPWFAAYAIVLLALYFWRAVPAWQALVVAGMAQALLAFACLFPVVLGVTQEPVRQAGRMARDLGGEVVTFNLYQPSFSVYRQAITPPGVPKLGQLALTRADKIDELVQAVAPLRVSEVYRQGFIRLVRIEAAQ